MYGITDIKSQSDLDKAAGGDGVHVVLVNATAELIGPYEDIAGLNPKSQFYSYDGDDEDILEMAGLSGSKTAVVIWSFGKRVADKIEPSESELKEVINEYVEYLALCTGREIGGPYCTYTYNVSSIFLIILSGSLL
jgi:hypothetical protein